MKIAIATCAALPPHFDDDRRLIAALHVHGAEARHAVWDDPALAWEQFDRVIIRTTWDYPSKHAAFLEWADALDGRLDNPAHLVRWNSDKHHLEDLAAAGIPTVPTQIVEPGDPSPALQGEVVVKPVISVAARFTGRFSPAAHAEAHRLIARHHADGRASMVQPYLASVERAGETALVFLDGSYSHAAHKRAVLRADEVAPMRDDAIGGAEVMYGTDIVAPGTATPAQISLGERTIGFLRHRFDMAPLYARVDVIAGDEGEPLVLELEAVEPNLFLAFGDGAAERLAAAIVSRVDQLRPRPRGPRPVRASRA